MPQQTVNNIPGAVPPLADAYSQAVVSNGTVYVSGSIGCDDEFDIIGGIQSQIRLALANMRTLLEGAGAGLEDVLKVTAYLTNLERDIHVFNEIYLEYFKDAGRRPARTCVGVSSLRLGAFVEIDCIAQLPTGCEECDD